MPLAELQKQASDYQLIEQAIQNLGQTAIQHPNLKKLAGGLGLSEFHFQRLFSRWAGVSPKRFLQFLTLKHAKSILEQSENLLEVTLETGVSSVSRLHDLFLQCEAITPGEYRARGKGLTISYGYHPSPFGECLLGATDRGICGLTFIQHGDRQPAYEIFRRRWKEAILQDSPTSTSPFLNHLFSGNRNQRNPLYLFVKGTNFQIKVWEALLRIPSADMISYHDVARHLGMPNASRAVANAVAQNPIQYLIPCHRVIQSMGAFGVYQGGLEREKALLCREAAQIDS